MTNLASAFVSPARASGAAETANGQLMIFWLKDDGENERTSDVNLAAVSGLADEKIPREAGMPSLLLLLLLMLAVGRCRSERPAAPLWPPERPNRQAAERPSDRSFGQRRQR
jgi:hypothetical protein